MHHKKLKQQSVTFCALQLHQKGLHVVPPHYCWLNVGGNVTNRAPSMKCQPGLTGLPFLTGSFVSKRHLHSASSSVIRGLVKNKIAAGSK